MKIKFKEKINIAKKKNKIIACLIEQGTFQKSINNNSKNNFKIEKKDFLFFLQKKIFYKD